MAKTFIGIVRDHSMSMRPLLKAAAADPGWIAAALRSHSGK